MLVSHPRYWLKNAHIPLCLIKDNLHLFSDTTRENLCLCDIEISQGKITQIIPACENTIGIDLKKELFYPVLLIFILTLIKDIFGSEALTYREISRQP